eukprot:PhF_6_TR25281/c0_g1_i1/m.34848
MFGTAPCSGLFQPTSVTCVPPELNLWVTTPSWLTQIETQQKLQNSNRPTSLAVHNVELNVDSLRQSVCYILSLCSTSMNAMSISCCLVPTPDAWAFFFQCAALCTHLVVLDLQRTQLDCISATTTFPTTVLTYCRSLTELNLSENLIHNETDPQFSVSVMLRAMVSVRCPVQRLGLRNVGIVREISILSVMDLLRSLPALCQIDLTQNGFPLSQAVIDSMVQLDKGLKACHQKLWSSGGGSRGRSPTRGGSTSPGRRTGTVPAKHVPIIQMPSNSSSHTRAQRTLSPKQLRYLRQMPTYVLGKRLDRLLDAGTPQFSRPTTPPRTTSASRRPGSGSGSAASQSAPRTMSPTIASERRSRATTPTPHWKGCGRVRWVQDVCLMEPGPGAYNIP